MNIRKHQTIPIVLLFLAMALTAFACGSEQPAGSENGDAGVPVSEAATAGSDEGEVSGSDNESGEGHEAEAANEATGHAGDEGQGHVAEEDDHGHSSEAAVVEDAPEVVLRTTEWDFQPETLRLTKGEPVTIVLENEGVIEHEVELPGLHLHAQAGETVKGSFVPDETGTFEFACELPGHREAGMVGSLIVEPDVHHEDTGGHRHNDAA